METELIIKEIDNLHLAANLSLKNKNFTNYIDHFSGDLKYKQLDGKTIDKTTLTKDTQKYFDRIKSCETNYSRINCSIENNLFVETIVQKASVSIQVFLFFTKKWTVERQGTYKWERSNDNWKIVSVEITKEKVY